MQIIRLASYAGTPVECVVAPEDIFMNKMAHRPFRFLIVQQETVVLIKLSFANDNAIYISCYPN